MSGSAQNPTGPYDPADLIEVPDEATQQDPTGPTVPPSPESYRAVMTADPVTGYIPAPLLTGADGKTSLDLDALPLGTAGGDLPVADAPQGARNAAIRIDGNWVWRLISGEGWAVRQGKGPERSDGTRPKLAILEPCASVTLRAVGVDEAFSLTTHHVVIAWVRLTRADAWKAEAGWAGSTEPFGIAQSIPGGRVTIRRGWTAGPRRIGVTACKGVLAVPPDTRVIAAALAAADPADSDQDVST